MSRGLEFYRPNVGIMLLNKDNKVFVGQRLDSPGPAWQMPQGGVEEGEPLLEAAFRELEEEIGTRHACLLDEIPGWYFYDLPLDLQKSLWAGQYKGQRQKWFLMRFLGSDEDINLQTTHPEFSAWQWIEPGLLPGLAIEFKRAVYEKLYQFFRPYLEKGDL